MKFNIIVSFIISIVFLSCNRNTNRGEITVTDPQFTAISRNDDEIKKAHDRASASISEFIELVQGSADVTYMAKLQFLDEDLSDKLGEDRFFYLWLNNVVYHSKEKMLSGMFFEVPSDLKDWYKVEERLAFEPDDVFDWMINDNGHVKGGFTIRLARSRLNTESEKQEYDEYSGITSYEPLVESK